MAKIEVVDQKEIQKMNDLADAFLKSAESLSKLIDQGNKLIEINNKIGVSSDSNKTKQEQLTEIEKEAQNIRKQTEKTKAKLAAKQDESAKQLAREQELLKRRNKELRDAAKAQVQLEKKQEAGIKDAEKLNDAYKRQSQRLNELRQDAKDIGIVYGTTSDEFKNASEEVNKLDEELKDLDKSLGQSNRQVGNYKEEIGEAFKEQEIFGGSLSKLETIFSTTTGAIGAGVAILGGLAKAYVSSARGAEDLARASDRLNSISRQIGNAIADEAGEAGFLDKVLAGLQAQYLGIGSAVNSNIEVFNRAQLRQIEISEVDQERQKKAQLDEAERQRQIRDEERNSFEVRRAANNELLSIIDDREKKTIAFQEKRLAIFQRLLSADKENIELQRQIKEVEFEIADAREEAQGFRSEQQANDLALSRELNANLLQLTQSRIQGEILATEEGSDERFMLERELIESTRKLQIQAAGQNQELRDIANQEAKNSLFELNEEIEEAAKERIKFEKSLNDELIKEEDSSNSEIEKLRLENLKSVEDSSKIIIDSEKKAADERLRIEDDLQSKLRDMRIDLAAQAASAVTDILFEASSQRRDEELERLDEQREEDLERITTETEEDLANEDAKVEAGIISEEQAEARKKEIIIKSDAEKAKIEEAADRREAKIKTKQAIAEKKAAIAQIAIDAAVGILQAKAAAAATFGASLALIPFIIAGAAISTATVLATPTPKFEKGTKGKYNTPNTWIGGEKGSEMVLSPQGKMFLTPDQPTLFENMPNHMVIPHKETQRKLAEMAINNNGMSFSDVRIVNGLQKIEKAVGSRQERTEKNGIIYSRKRNRLEKRHQSFLEKMKY